MDDVCKCAGLSSSALKEMGRTAPRDVVEALLRGCVKGRVREWYVGHTDREGKTGCGGCCVQLAKPYLVEGARQQGALANEVDVDENFSQKQPAQAHAEGHEVGAAGLIAR